MVDDGFVVFDAEPDVQTWAAAAHKVACTIAADPSSDAANLRHADTWYVGVDALPNETDGSIDNKPLVGPWQAYVAPATHWHSAQLSIVFPGYPGQDTDESDANHRYRITRHGAHVDGLLPIGPTRARFLREPHAFVLGLPLNRSNAAPLMVWPGSHHIMGDAFRDFVGTADPMGVDLTACYQAARRVVFESCVPVPIIAEPGQSMLLHRHLLHGVAPWEPEAHAPPEGRMIAYFRPEFCASEWLKHG